MNSVKEIDTENRTYYFFDDTINIKNLDLNESDSNGTRTHNQLVRKRTLNHF